MSNPKWYDAGWAPIGNNFVDPEWITQGLFYLASKEGIPYHSANIEGAVVTEKCLDDFKLLDGNYECAYVSYRLITPMLVSEGHRKNLVVRTVAFFNEISNTYVSVNLGNSTSTVGIVGLDTESFEDAVTFWSAKVRKPVNQGQVFVMVSDGHGGYEFKRLGRAGVPVEPDNYAPSVMTDFRHVCEDLVSDNPCGRIIILNGDPGTGKSFLVRGILESVAGAIFILIQPNLIAHLSSPEMINSLMNLRGKQNIPIVFIVEDADTIMMERGTDNMAAVSAMLNMGDGILSSMLDIRVVTTTNAGVEDLDKAIVRPGRLCRRIDIGTLDGGQASAVYKRLTGKDVAFKSCTLATIYRMARNDGWKPPKMASGLGFHFIEDDGVVG